MSASCVASSAAHAVPEDASRLPKAAQAKIAPVPLERPAREERIGG